MAEPSEPFFTKLNLLIAYRKAKADAFYERDHVTASDFCLYESNLQANLDRLLERLSEPSPTWHNDDTIVGNYSYIPKGIETPEDDSNRTESKSVSFITSDCDLQWTQECERYSKKPKAQFRLVGRHSIDYHVICALWIMKVGHKYDGVLGENILGSRLRRVRSKSRHLLGEPNRIAIGSFRPYAPDFKAWRANGLKAIRSALERNEAVVAITTDLKSFYHRASTDYLINPEFLRATGIELTPEQELFTTRLMNSIAIWSAKTPLHKDIANVGLPVGISAPRVIANALLWGFDRFVTRELTPLYYGRYVDDVFLVLPNNRQFKDASDVWDYVIARSKSSDDGVLLSRQGNSGSDNIKLSLPYSSLSELEFGAKKSKVFSLDPETGESLLDSIEHSIATTSSEWRLLPDLPDNDGELGIEFLSAGRSAAEEVDNLRKADGLTVRKLKLAIRLRNLEAVERDLAPNQWVKHRRTFFKAVQNHALSVRGLFEFSPYIPRFFGLAVASGDWDIACRCADRLAKVWRLLEKHCDADPEALRKCKEHMVSGVEEAIAKALNGASESTAQQGLGKLLEKLGKVSEVRTELEIVALGKALFSYDLGRHPWREVLLDDSPPTVPSVEETPTIALVPEELKALCLSQAEEFLTKLDSALIRYPVLPNALVFPTRPLSTAEVTTLDQSCLRDLPKLRRVMQGLRGATLEILPSTSLAGGADGGGADVITVRDSHRKKQPTIALACLQTDEESWRADAAGMADPMASERYFRINRLVNDVLRRPSRAQYLVLPELCLPRRWFSRIANKVGHSGVSVIAGLGYRHWDDPVGATRSSSGGRHVSNTVRVSLTTDAIGYRSLVIYEQEKSAPALEEESELWSIAKKTLRSQRTPSKAILDHDGFRFGLLICSELSNLKFRQNLGGKVDALFVLEWNKDVDTFSSLVEASALDIHCFVVQSNNRLYGDCRIRAPYREHFKRDLARVKGGEHDYFVVAKLDVEALRAFQTRARSPRKDEFKPVPDGFPMDAARRSVPSK